MFYLHLALAGLFQLTTVASAPTPAMTPEEILRFMDEIPACESERVPQCLRAGGWSRIGSASEIAQAISEVARSRDEAERMAIYAAFESAMVKRAVGDGGQSRGIVQLQGVADEIAFSPKAALIAWQAKVDAVWCAGNPPDEELAALASGNCAHGRILVRRREQLRRRLDAKLVARDSPVAVE